MSNLADRMRPILYRKRLSIRAASLAAGMGPDSLGKIFSGKTKVPRGDHLLAIAKVLGVTPGWLLTGEGEASPSPTAKVA